jgi:CRP-like cAMP-binding protein
MAEHKALESLLSVAEVRPILDRITVLAGLNDQQLHTLFRLLRVVAYRHGEIVFEQGSEPSYIYIIERGRIKLVVSNDHTPLELIELETGACFGETAVIGIQPHEVSAVAEGDVRLIVLSRETLLNLYQTDLELYSLVILNIAREACRRLAKTDQILLHYVLDE